MSLLLVLLAAFYFYFMLGLTFNAALRTNGALMLAYALAALGGAIAALRHQNARPRWLGLQRARE
jgi:hypothetical protein